MDDAVRGRFSVKTPLDRSIKHLFAFIKAKASSKRFMKDLVQHRRDKGHVTSRKVDLESYAETLHKNLILPLTECLENAHRIHDWLMDLEWRDYEVTSADYRKICEIGVSILGPPPRALSTESMLERLSQDVRKEHGYKCPRGWHDAGEASQPPWGKPAWNRKRPYPDPVEE